MQGRFKFKPSSPFEPGSNVNVLNMLYFRKLITVSTAIAYKNRFLLCKRSTRHQLVGLLQYKGQAATLRRAVGMSYVFFLRFFRGIKLPEFFNDYYSRESMDLGEFSSLYASYALFRDLPRALGWRLQDSLPIIKAVSHKINMKKKKKKLKMKTRRFKIVYKYIYAERRQQVATRWLSLLIKTASIKLVHGLYKTLVPFIVKPSASKLPAVRRSVYSGLLASR